MPDVARKWRETSCEPLLNLVPTPFTHSVPGVFLLLQSSGNSIHWKVIGVCRGAAEFWSPSLKIDSVLP
jgi:hypothetical protein